MKEPYLSISHKICEGPSASVERDATGAPTVASLREIDRRSAVLGGALRRGVQDIEDAEFKMIERRQLKGKDAA